MLLALFSSIILTAFVLATYVMDLFGDNLL
jgi:hypothetical protein